MADARILSVSDVSYYGDPCERPSLSQSIAHTLLTKSPLHAWQEHPRLGGVRRGATASMRKGSLVDSLLLGDGSEIVVIDAPDFRTKEAQKLRDAALAQGKTPILPKELEPARETVDSIRASLEGHGIELAGHSQFAVEWTEDTIHGPIFCRGKLDHFSLETRTIYDLKTSNSAHPAACARHVLDYGYHIQQAAYTRAIEKLHPALLGRLDFVFLFVEPTPPYAVTPARLTGPFRELGMRQWDRACETWAWCLSRNIWPGYADGIVALEPPPWALAQDLAETA
jgi:hypothetical protein